MTGLGTGCQGSLDKQNSNISLVNWPFRGILLLRIAVSRGPILEAFLS